MICAVNRVINDVSTSLAESIPSAITAKLPDIIPTTILSIDNTALPITATHEALIIFLSRTPILICIFLQKYKKLTMLDRNICFFQYAF